MSALARIPVPLQQRLRHARLRLVPPIIFAAALAGIVLMLAVPTLVGQAEPLQAAVSCYKPGLLAELSVTRFQKVKAGDAVGQVLITDPKILASSLAVAQAEIEMLRISMRPTMNQQRTAMDYDQLRLDWMKQRAQLAMARVNLQLAVSEFHRTEELFKDKIVSARVFDQAKAAQERSQSEVDELARLVEEQGRNFKELQLTNSLELSKITDDSLRAAIALQESKLRLTEAELSPITLKAPVDGTVSLIHRRAGEAISAGEPIVSIAALNSIRIVGYLRPPIREEPKVGTRVEVRTRGPRPEVGSGAIIEVGAQLEPVNPVLLGPIKFASIDLGLPIGVSLPPVLKIRPGELVDLRFLPEKN